MMTTTFPKPNPVQGLGITQLEFVAICDASQSLTTDQFSAGFVAAITPYISGAIATKLNALTPAQQGAVASHAARYKNVAHLKGSQPYYTAADIILHILNLYWW